MPLRFGAAGVPRSTKKSGSVNGIARIRELGLDHMELEWVHRVNMGDETAAKIKAAAIEHDVTLTAHGPYYINLNAQEGAKVEASVERVLATARTGQKCGAESVLFHAAFMMKMPPEDVYKTVLDRFKGLMATLKKEGVTVDVRPELAGKLSAWGSLEEIVRLSAQLKGGVKPAVDFAHQHARTQAFNTYPEFCDVLETLKKGLGPNILKDMHIHVSGIKHSQKGELEHLNLKDSDFNYKELMRALADYGVEGYLVCESPNLEEDALLMQAEYNKLRQ